MTLYEQLKQDCIKCLKSKNPQELTILKTLIGEIERNPSKDYSDSSVIRAVKKYLKNLEEMKKYGKEVDKEIQIVSKYLPKQISENEVIDFLKTVDFSKLKSKFAAIGLCKKQFGENVDANLVKKILQEKF
jgi:uncharacterized protein YqeY